MSLDLGKIIHHMLIMENQQPLTLDDGITFEQLRSSGILRAYHSSQDIKFKPRKRDIEGSKHLHVGSVYQAECRADSIWGDIGYDGDLFLHQLDIDISGMCPQLYTEDDPEDQSLVFIQQGYTCCAYSNSHEGEVGSKPNLSIVIFNPKIIKSVQFVSKLTSPW